ncbi:MAG TPA: Hsp33 family molecular chaperone [Bauldia sp.]|nr:Hsp33 family molecular chaperone [Bauldia sp.]
MDQPNPGPRPAGDDAVLPFEVAPLDIRGRAIQMGPAIDAILARHAYPDSVSRLVAEAVVLAVLLGSSLKFDGKFILQTETDGPVDMLVADYRTSGEVRAYARFDAARVAAAEAAGDASPGELLGTGTLAMTVDQGAYMSRYQGVVPLEGQSLEDVAHTYFRQSEQIPTRVRLAVGEIHQRENGLMQRAWRAGGLIVQFLPDAPERMRRPDLPGGDVPEGSEVDASDEDDAWIEAQSLVGTIEDHELTDPAVPVERLLYRLFHQRGVRVFTPLAIADNCSCSRERIAGMLSRFSPEEIADSIEDGKIAVTCEFCGTRYEFDPAEFAEPGDGA